MPETVVRLKEKYQREVVQALMREFSIANVMDVPRLEKIVVNMGVGDATADPKLIDAASADLAQITGQKAAVRRARKSVSNFKLRAGMPIGCMVTLRRERMWEFMERLFNVAIPRIRDFRGVSPKGFDQFGNYTLGLRDQTIFPEVDIDKVVKVRGMNVTFVFKRPVPREQARAMLKMLGMPFSG